MRPPSPPPPPADDAYLAGLVALGQAAGLQRVGVASASVMGRARAELLRRRDAGLADGMAFTYKNPHRSTDPAGAVRGARTLVVGARSYWQAEPERRPTATGGPHGSIARYAWRDVYGELRHGLAAMAARLRADGYRAVVFADDNSVVDREAAWLAGVGWFGRHANLLLPGAGSWFVLGAVVTDAALPINEAVVDDGCGGCTRCIPACPTGAIVADGVIDARRCLAWVLQKPGIIPEAMREAVGERMYGCDDCQTSCPITVRLGQRRSAAEGDTAAPRATVDVLALLEASDDELLATWGRWYLADRDPRWVRRNALVVLGNTGDRSHLRTRDVLAKYVASDDQVIRVHAVWAARRLGLHP